MFVFEEGSIVNMFDLRRGGGHTIERLKLCMRYRMHAMQTNTAYENGNVKNL